MKWLRNRVGHRGACLLFFAVLDLIYGPILIVQDPLPGSPVAYLAVNWPPLPVWGVAWTAVGLVCLVQAFMRRDQIAFACAMAIKFLWATAHLWALLDGAHRALASVIIWMWAVALVGVIATWPEPTDFPAARHE